MKYLEVIVVKKVKGLHKNFKTLTKKIEEGIKMEKGPPCSWNSSDVEDMKNDLQIKCKPHQNCNTILYRI